MKVIFLAYREWAINVFSTIQQHPSVEIAILCKSEDELLNVDIKSYDLLISCGWSKELGEEICSQITAIGVHCAELDRYSYGTPLQLQIMDGLQFTKHRIFSFTHDESSKRAHTHNRLYSHEVVLDLSGNMMNILEQMTATSKVLFNMYLNDYPDICWREWPKEDIVTHPRSEKDSRLTKESFQNMTTEDLYNFFRSLEEPYPNGYIEDNVGRLYIKQVGFKRNG